MYLPSPPALTNINIHTHTHTHTHITSQDIIIGCSLGVISMSTWKMTPSNILCAWFSGKHGVRSDDQARYSRSLYTHVCTRHCRARSQQCYKLCYRFNQRNTQVGVVPRSVCGCVGKEYCARVRALCRLIFARLSFYASIADNCMNHHIKSHRSRVTLHVKKKKKKKKKKNGEYDKQQPKPSSEGPSCTCGKKRPERLFGTYHG